MPYPTERASRLGHVPVVNSTAVRDAFTRWQLPHVGAGAGVQVDDLCIPVTDLAGDGVFDRMRSVIAVDGSDTEVEATQAHPTVKVEYVRVAAVLVDLRLLAQAGRGTFVDPRLVRGASERNAFDGALPGSGLVLPGMSGVDTWRCEVDRFLTEARYDSDSDKSLADMLLALDGGPASPSATLTVNRCPSCPAGTRATVEVGPGGAVCPRCGADVHLADVLRTHEEYSTEGSNRSALTRVMLVAERLTTLGFLQHFYDTASWDALASTVFVQDGPLALFGSVATLKFRWQNYLADLGRACEEHGRPGVPLLVGVEKSGRFVEHAETIRDLIPVGHVMRLPVDYLNRVTGRRADNEYGSHEYYGRRFIYRTTSGDPLVITVPPRPGVLPYEGADAELWESYPALRPVCEVLDLMRTRLYTNAVIPVAMAHTAASLPLGVGQSVLRSLSQQQLGLHRSSQFRPAGPFPHG